MWKLFRNRDPIYTQTIPRLTMAEPNISWITEFPNFTVNATDKENYVPYHQRLETYIVPVVFFFIFVVGLLGNGTLVYIFLRNSSMRSVPNTYIISLAIGDLMVVVGTVPFISTIYTFDSWPYGVFICKLSEFLKDVSVGVTVLTLTMLSMDRYIAIALPIQKLTGRLSKSLTIVAAISVWLASITLALPGAYYSYVLEIPVNDDRLIYICYPFPKSMSPWYPKVMVLTKFLMLYAIPLAMIACFYALMARQLLKSAKNTVGKNDSHAKQLKGRAKVAKIVMAFVLVFAVCFFPSQLFMMWFYFHPNSESNYNEFWHVLKICGYVLTFVNSCLNPIVLCVISGVYRKYFRRYLCCCYQKKKSEGNVITFRTIQTTSVRSHSMNATTIAKI